MSDWRTILRRLESAVEDVLRRGEREKRMGDLDQAPDPTTVVDRFASLPHLVAVDRARSEWASEIREPPGSGWRRIDPYIRSSEGLGWPGADAADLGKRVPYTKNRQFAWCGAFVAFCWSSVRSEIRRKHFSSCYRLWTWAKAEKRLVSTDEIRAGDIALVGNRKSRAWGAHVVLCTAGVVDDHVATIEGNAKGMGVDGNVYEGVIQRRRRITPSESSEYYVMHVIRLSPQDLTSAG